MFFGGVNHEEAFSELSETDREAIEATASRFGGDVGVSIVGQSDCACHGEFELAGRHPAGEFLEFGDPSVEAHAPVVSRETLIVLRECRKVGDVLELGLSRILGFLKFRSGNDWQKEVDEHRKEGEGRCEKGADAYKKPLENLSNASRLGHNLSSRRTKKSEIL